MAFEGLPTELVLQVFRACTAVSDVLNLASSCRRFKKIYNTSQRLHLLFEAAEAEFGPLKDAVQVATHNGIQPSHLIRSVPQSFALLKQLLAIGRVAKRWEELYPLKKWKWDYENRRLLSQGERFRLRRAIYRLWLYDRAFHNQNHPRYSRHHPGVVLERAELLHNWTNPELAEIDDVRGVIRQVIERYVCPSNGTVQRKFRKRFPDAEHQLSFNIHLNYPSSASFPHHVSHMTHSASSVNKAYSKYMPTLHHEPGAEGWGDDILHYYVVEDMMKLDPGQIMWLKENAPFKREVEMYVKSLGEWFENNGDTFGQTLDWVLKERGDDPLQFKDTVSSCEAGIVIGEGGVG